MPDQTDLERADLDARRRALWEAKGYEVREGFCPECGHGLILRHRTRHNDGSDRWVCTSYAQCELSVG